MSDDNLVQLGSLGPVSPPSTPPVFETDPVCKMKVMPATAAGQYDYKGKTYYFCAQRCLERFRGSPEQFLVGVSARLKSSSSKVRHSLLYLSHAS